MTSRLLTSVLWLALPSLSVAQGQAWIVDDDPGPDVDFHSIAAAVSAAASGDAVIVNPGTYSNQQILIDQKSLVLSASAAGGVSVAGNVTVRQLGASQRAVVRGLEANAGGLLLTIEDCAGVSWIEDCAFHCGLGCSQAARFTDSDQVVLVRCELKAMGPNPLFGGFAGPALRAEDSTLYLYDCLAVGGPGGGEDCYTGNPFGASGDDGDPGALITGGTLYTFSSSFEGGPGGTTSASSYYCLSCQGGDGGAGLELQGGAVAYANRTDLSAGAGGVGTGICTQGNPGPSLSAAPGASFQELVGHRRSIEAPSPVTPGQQVDFTIESTATGDTTFVYASFGASLLPLLGADNVGLLALPLIYLGSTSAPSPATFPFLAPPLPPGWGFLEVHLQCISLTAVGLARLTAPTGVTLLTP